MTLYTDLVAAITKRIDDRRWKGLSAVKYNRLYAEGAATRFLSGTLTVDDTAVLGLPEENSGSPDGAQRWIDRGLGDNHFDEIMRATRA